MVATISFDVDQHGDDGNEQQDMNEPAQLVPSEQSQKPGNQE